MSASAFLDVCRFNPTAGGTTDWTVSSAVTGYQTPAAAGAVNGVQYSYRAESADLSQWEVGTGAYNTSTGVLSRTTVLYNSAGTTAKINFSAAPQVAIVALKEDFAPILGQCKLSLVGGNLVLKPLNGNLLTINGSAYPVPNSGVTLAATGLTASTLYYVYAYMNAGTMTLEASTTAHVTSTTAGNSGTEIKSGDDTRTLVGMAYPVAGPAFADTVTQRFVRSWFNDFGVEQINTFTGSGSTRVTTTSVYPSFAELQTSARINTLLWAGERWALEGDGGGWLGASGAVYFAISVDGSSFEPNGSQGNSSGAGVSISFNANALKTGLSEGFHYATLMGCVSSNTGTYATNGVDSYGCGILGMTRR